MQKISFDSKIAEIVTKYNELIRKKNDPYQFWNNTVFQRYKRPILTRDHIPPFWRYDLNPKTNPFLLERLGVNATLNSGAIELNGKYYLVVRTEGYDRKSFFAVAESETGIDNFEFWDHPCVIPETDDRDVNIYDMRLVKHEDGWIYGTFCSERKDLDAAPGDTSMATAKGGIVRTKDLKTWERLPDLDTVSPQQRNVVLHPEFVDGKYAFYTRPQDGFIQTGTGGGISWGLCDDITNAKVEVETVIDPKLYHTIKEVKNGMGAPPIKTEKGWLHIAHGVRDTAAGLRYVLYAFMCDLNEPNKVIASPGGHFLAPLEYERVGDVSNVVFCNGLITKDNGDVYIYYASSDTRMHVATTTVNRLLDYVFNTPEDPLFTADCVSQRIDLIDKNLEYINNSNNSILKDLLYNKNK